MTGIETIPGPISSGYTKREEFEKRALEEEKKRAL